MTIARSPVPPVVKTVTVRAAPARAFALFAEDLARWWPLAQFHTGPDPVDCTIEPGSAAVSSNARPTGAKRPGDQSWPMTRHIVSRFPGSSDYPLSRNS